MSFQCIHLSIDQFLSQIENDCILFLPISFDTYSLSNTIPTINISKTQTKGISEIIISLFEYIKKHKVSIDEVNFDVLKDDIQDTLLQALIRNDLILIHLKSSTSTPFFDSFKEQMDLFNTHLSQYPIQYYNITLLNYIPIWMINNYSQHYLNFVIVKFPRLYSFSKEQEIPIPEIQFFPQSSEFSLQGIETRQVEVFRDIGSNWFQLISSFSNHFIYVPENFEHCP